MFQSGQQALRNRVHSPSFNPLHKEGELGVYLCDHCGFYHLGHTIYHLGHTIDWKIKLDRVFLQATNEKL